MKGSLRGRHIAGFSFDQQAGNPVQIQVFVNPWAEGQDRKSCAKGAAPSPVSLSLSQLHQLDCKTAKHPLHSHQHFKQLKKKTQRKKKYPRLESQKHALEHVVKGQLPIRAKQPQAKAEMALQGETLQNHTGHVTEQHLSFVNGKPL